MHLKMPSLEKNHLGCCERPQTVGLQFISIQCAAATENVTCCHHTFKIWNSGPRVPQLGRCSREALAQGRGYQLQMSIVSEGLTFQDPTLCQNLNLMSHCIPTLSTFNYWPESASVVTIHRGEAGKLPSNPKSMILYSKRDLKVNCKFLNTDMPKNIIIFQWVINCTCSMQYIYKTSLITRMHSLQQGLSILGFSHFSYLVKAFVLSMEAINIKKKKNPKNWIW